MPNNRWRILIDVPANGKHVWPKEILHLTAEQKIAALAEVIRQTGGGRR